MSAAPVPSLAQPLDQPAVTRPDSLPLPRREPAAPDDVTERLGDWGLLSAALAGLEADLEACQGVLLVHADGSRECVEAADCPADPVLHTGSAPCSDVGGCC